MRRKATRMSQCRRVPLPNLLRSSFNLGLSPWNLVSGATYTNGLLTFTANAFSAAEQAVLISGGTALKSFTVAAVVSVSSGTLSFSLKNTHGGVKDNFSPNKTATTTPNLFAFTVTNGSAPGGGNQLFGVTNYASAIVQTLRVHSAILLVGAFTEQQIIDSGGIPVTN
jgi:hypothetical protein